MNNTGRPTQSWILCAFILVLWAGTSGYAQKAGADQDQLKLRIPTNDSFDGLNFIGGDAAYPPFSDTVLGEGSDFRRTLLRRGMALRIMVQAQYAQNTLDAPVPPDDQVYLGQRPFESAFVEPILTANLHQLRLRQSQLYVSGIWNWASWDPGGPKTFQICNLYLYKEFDEGHITMKAGYMPNQLEFVGFFMGGSTAAGAEGAYLVLPYEVGMSYFPLTAPSLDVQIRASKNTYFKTGTQRSIDPNGGLAEVARNATGFRFRPHGDKVLSINEGGFVRRASAGTHEAWFRAGYIHNFTPYRSEITGRNDASNYCAYALGDYQVSQPNRDHPSQGWYLGASAEATPETLNPYARYLEGRIYKEAPFRSRPSDVASLDLSRTGYSRYFTGNLVAQGRTVSHGLTTLIGSYSLHVSPGNYLDASLIYMSGPAISPRTPNALNFSVAWTTFF